MIFNKQEKKLILELICNEQIRMIMKDAGKYDSKRYKSLERLKVMIKDNHKDKKLEIIENWNEKQF